MSSRVQVILSDAERELFRRQAAARKMSLSSWLREAGLQRLEAEQDQPIRTVRDLHKFFASLPEESGVEPDWAEHLRVMAESRARGAASS